MPEVEAVTTVRQLIAMLLKCPDLDEQIIIRDRPVRDLKVNAFTGILPHYYAIEDEK